MKVSINRQLLGIEDLLLGEGTVTQPRGSADVTVTKINAQNLPWGPIEGQTYAEAIEEKVQICETAATTVTDAVALVDPLMANITNINLLANDLPNVDLVANNLPNVDIVAGNSTNINLVAGNEVNIDTVADNTSNINIVAANDSNITAVAGNATNINEVATLAPGIGTINANSGNIAIVANDLSLEYAYIDDYGSIVDPVESGVVTQSGIITVAENIVPNLAELLLVDDKAAQVAADTITVVSAKDDAVLAASNADASEVLAGKWASEAEDIIVADGKYSSYHWAQKAADIVLGGGSEINDTSISSLTTFSSAKITTALPKVGLDIANITAPSTGQIAWNMDERTADLGLNGVTLQLGQEELVFVRNSTASTITNKTVCMATGSIGNSGRITISPMDGTNPLNAMRLLGIATEDILAGEDGYIVNFGKLREVDTSMWNDGDILYTSTSALGGLTNVEPTSGLKQPIAFVVKAHTAGTLFVRIETLDKNAYLPLSGDFTLDLGGLV